jgi:hypothetical protein
MRAYRYQRFFKAVVVSLSIATCSFPLRAMAAEPIDEDRPLPDRPAQAAEFRALLVAGRPDVVVPANALPIATQKINQLRQQVPGRMGVQRLAMIRNAAQGNPATIGGIPVGPLPEIVEMHNNAAELVPQNVPLDTSTAINPAGWKWIGPGNIGGRIRSILIHPSQPQIMWVGGVAGGVWKTLDGGITWAPLYDLMANVAVSCMALHPREPDILFAGTGEGSTTSILSAASVFL